MQHRQQRDQDPALAVVQGGAESAERRHRQTPVTGQNTSSRACKHPTPDKSVDK
jgi:hypothetical protein